MQRTVSSRIVLDVTEPAELVFAVAVSAHYRDVDEEFTATVDGTPVESRPMSDAHGTRLRALTSPTGRLEVTYRAEVRGLGDAATASSTDRLVYLRPSRYAQSDALLEQAAEQFGGIDEPADVLRAVSSWVGTRLSYVPGSSGPTDGATRTLEIRKGVCRDYAHVCVALLRARGIPARTVAVYAPGLDPMDFHAVAEAWVEGAWRVVDATTLAPRSTLVRIATGRDAADTAFLTVVSGRTDLVETEITAVVDELPGDDLDDLVQIR